MQLFPFPSMISGAAKETTRAFPFVDYHFTPHYPSKSPLDDVLGRVVPGTDEYVSEKHAFEIMRLLNEWSQVLKAEPPALAVAAKFLDASIEGASLIPIQEKNLRSANGIEIRRRQFSGDVLVGRERLLQEIKHYLAPMSRVETAEFEIMGIKETAGESKRFLVDIRYDFVGTRMDLVREERIGVWRTQ